MRNRYRQKFAGFLMIALVGAAAVLGGCGTKEGAGPADSRAAGAETAEAGTAGYEVDSIYTLPISEKEWRVETNDYGDLIFMEIEDEKMAFSASKWEGMILPSKEEYQDYYERYLAGIQEDHPEAEAVSFDIPETGGVLALYMGVEFQLSGETYRVCMYLIPAPGGRDTLSFTMTVPKTEADAAEGKFRSIVEGIHFAENNPQQG